MLIDLLQRRTACFEGPSGERWLLQTSCFRLDVHRKVRSLLHLGWRLVCSLRHLIWVPECAVGDLQLLQEVGIALSQHTHQVLLRWLLSFHSSLSLLLKSLMRDCVAAFRVEIRLTGLPEVAEDDGTLQQLVKKWKEADSGKDYEKRREIARKVS